MTENANNHSTPNPSYVILAGGQEVPFSIRPVSIVVAKQLNKIAFAKIIFPDGDPASKNFTKSSSDHFVPGKELEIKAGYGQDDKTIFKGKITRHSIKARQGQMGMLLIECRDAAYEMTLSPKSKYFYDLSDSEIFEEIIGNYSGLSKNVESTSASHAVMVQFKSTDWDFIIKRAEANSKVIFTDNGSVNIFSPEVNAASQKTYTYGTNILEFEASIDTRKSLQESTVQAWDASVQELISAEGVDPGEPGTGNLSATDLADNSPQGSDAEFSISQLLKAGEIQDIANAILLKSRLAKVQGRLKIQGDAELKPGMIIELQGLGDRFSGKAFVGAVRHELGDGNFITDMELGVNEEWFGNNENEDKTPPLLPRAQGLQVGVVTELEDPDGEDRVKVVLPVISPAEEGYWCRIATLDAGENRGSFFRPEIGDEVIVGFIEDDPRHPVILGMMNSSAKPAPSPGSDDNHEKGFVTRSGIKLWFNDDEKFVEIETPAGNIIKLSDSDKAISLTDENGNSIVMDANGIKLDSPADITLSAGGNVTIEGVSVEVSAQAGFKAEGSASAEVSSGGTAVLKGSLVQIN